MCARLEVTHAGDPKGVSGEVPGRAGVAGLAIHTREKLISGHDQGAHSG